MLIYIYIYIIRGCSWDEMWMGYEWTTFRDGWRFPGVGGLASFCSWNGWDHKPVLCREAIYIYIIVELRTPATPVGVGGGKERGGCHLNLRTWHAEGRRPILGLCWPSLGLCWPILRLCWPMPMRTKCCNLQHFALWDGKNPCKYNSFSPRKWLKHSYLQSFVHITIFDFLKNV